MKKPTFLLALCLSFAARGQDNCDSGLCPEVPMPAHCTPETIILGKAQIEVLKSKIRSHFVDGKGTDQELMAGVVGDFKAYGDFVKFVHACEHPGQEAACEFLDNAFDPGLNFTVNLQKGWYRKFAPYTNKKNPSKQCALDVNRTLGEFTVRPADGLPVLDGSWNPTTGTNYSSKVNVICRVHGTNGWETERKYNFSRKGITVVDWSPAEKVEILNDNLGRKAAFGRELPITIVAQDNGNIRVTWENGSTPFYVELGADGKIKGSNVLDESTWNGECATESAGGGRYIPKLKLHPDFNYGNLSGVPPLKKKKK